MKIKRIVEKSIKKNESMTVGDLIKFLTKCDKEGYVFVGEEGILVNLYENDISIDEHGNVSL